MPKGLNGYKPTATGLQPAATAAIKNQKLVYERAETRLCSPSREPLHLGHEKSSKHLFKTIWQRHVMLCRCSTILVRSRDQELFCVSCDMFLRPEQEVSASAASTEQHTPRQAPTPAAASSQRQGTDPSVPSPGSGKHEEEAPHMEQNLQQAMSMQSSDKVQQLLVESMGLLAERLKEEITGRDISIDAACNSITALTAACEAVSRLKT